MAKDPLHWFTVSNGVAKIDVFQSTERITPDLKGAIAVSVEDGKGNVCVYVDAASTRADQDEALFHDLCGHCALAGKRGHFAHYSPAEEHALRKAQVGGWQILRNMGFRWPRRPRGTAALERAGYADVPASRK